jgi:hypothetical protein
VVRKALLTATEDARLVPAVAIAELLSLRAAIAGKGHARAVVERR